MAKQAVTLGHIRSQKKPVRKTVRLCNDSEITERLEEIEQELMEATLRNRMNSDDEHAKADLERLQQEQDHLLEEARKNSSKFVFQTIGRTKFDKLRTENPPEEKDLAEAKRRGMDPDELGWDLTNFPPIIISACCIEPVITVEEAYAMFDDPSFSPAELTQLFNAAVQVNMRSNVVNLGKDFRGTPNSTTS